MNGILVGVLVTLATLAALRVLRFAACRMGRGRRGLRRHFARRLLRRLDATPEQERVFLAEVEALGQAMRSTRQGFFDSREDLARLLEADSLDLQALADFGSRRVAPVDELRKRATEALARFHASLDGRQRRLLAEMVRAPAHGRC